MAQLFADNERLLEYYMQQLKNSIRLSTPMKVIAKVLSPHLIGSNKNGSSKSQALARAPLICYADCISVQILCLHLERPSRGVLALGDQKFKGVNLRNVDRGDLGPLILG